MSSPIHDSEWMTPTVGRCWNHIGIWGDSTCPQLEPFIHCRNCPVFEDSAIRLFDRPVPQAIIAEATALLAKPAEDERRGGISGLVVQVADEWLAFPVSFLTLVSEWKSIHTLPQSHSPHLAGIANIRGRVLLCASLARILGLPEGLEADDKKRRLVVATHEGNSWVFPVSQVDKIHRYHPSDIQLPPRGKGKAGQVYITGVLPHGDRRIGCLDVPLLFHTLSGALNK